MAPDNLHTRLAPRIHAIGYPAPPTTNTRLYAGGADPGCREPMWNPGISYNASAAPLGPFLAATNAYRRHARVWETLQVERWADDSFYAFSKGSNLAIFTNVGSSSGPQSRSVTYLPEGWADGTRACNVYACSQCATVSGGAFTTPPLRGEDGVAIYDPDVRC